MPLAGLSVGNVDLAGPGIDVDAGGQEELRAIRVQRPPLARPVGRVVPARLADLEQQLAAIARVLLHEAGAGGDDPDVAVRVDVAVVQPVADQRRVAPRPDHVPLGIELDDRRRQARPVEVLGHDVLAVEDEDPIPAADAHPAEAAGEPAVAERQLRPQRGDLVAGDLLRRGRRRGQDAAGDDGQHRADAAGQPYDGNPKGDRHGNLRPAMGAPWRWESVVNPGMSLPRYSSLSATSGSTAMARRAGR